MHIPAYASFANVNLNVGGLFKCLFWGGEVILHHPLSKTSFNYGRNLKFGT